MRHHRLRAVALVGLLLVATALTLVPRARNLAATCPHPTRAAYRAPAPSAPLEVRLQAALDRRVAEGAPGATLAIAGPGERPVWRGASGAFACGSVRPLRPGDAFRTASVTKPVTAATVLRLAEEGRLGLDDPIARHLPPDLVDRLHRLDGVSRGPRITIRQLLAHTSGIADYGTDPRWLAEVLRHPGRRWTPDELVDWAVVRGTPRFAPGAGFHYSDTGYVLLGMIVERVTGGPLHDAVRRLVLQPLGMRDTYLEHHERGRAGGPGRAHQYVWRFDTTRFDPTFDTFGGGGLVSTADDLTRFVRGLFEGPLLRRPGTLAAMLRVSGHEEYGLGVGRVSVGGATLWGHEGFFGAFAYFWPARGVSITGSTNAWGGSSRALMEDAVAELARP